MRRIAAVAVAILMVATACTATPPGGGPAPQAGGQPQSGGRIVYGFVGEITGLQPILSGDASEVVWGHIYPRVLQNNPDTGELGPGVAERYEQTADSVTFFFRDAKWSDGLPITGEDYKYSVEATLRAKNPIRRAAFTSVRGFQDYVDGRTDSLAGIQVSADGKRVTVQLANALCTAPRSLASAGGGLLPKHHFVKAWDNKTTDLTKSIDQATALNEAPPASAGPFMFKEWQKGVQVTLGKNPNYWRGAPSVDELIVKLYATPAAVKAALLTGEVTFGNIDPIDVAEIERTGAGKLKIARQTIATNYNFVNWNAKSPKAPWLASKEVRQALWYGVNVKTIIDRVLLGYATQIYTHAPKGSWVYPSGLNTYDYSVSKAKELLEKAGARMGADGVYMWTNGQPMQMRLEGPRPAEPIISVMQEQYKAIGIRIDPLIETGQALTERTDPTQLDWEASLWSNSISPDPDGAYIFFHSGQQGRNQFNRSHYENAEVSAALQQGRTGPDCSTETRKRHYELVNKQLNEDAPVLFLWNPDSLIAYSAQVQNFGQKPYGLTTSGDTWDWNAEKLWLAK